MLLAVVLLAVGGGVLYVGAEAAVRGGSGLARALGVSAFGAALLAARAPVPSPNRLMVLAPGVHLMAGAFAVADRYVARLEGILLLVFYGAYVGLVLRDGRSNRDDEPARAGPSAGPAILLTVGGLVAVAGGAALLVAGGARLVRETGLTAGFVGAAVLGILVSLDEVLLEVVPVRRGSPELATGNLFGTLAAFTTGVLGLAALYAVVATVFVARGRAGRVLGVFVLAAYAAWLVWAATV